MPTELLWLAAITSAGFFLTCLGFGFGLARDDQPWPVIVAFALGAGLVWPLFVALLLLLAAFSAAALVLYMPVLLVAALRGKHPLVRVTKTGTKESE